MSARRLCPLCDAEMPDERCPVHEVPTIAIGTSKGPPAKLEVGSIIVGKYQIAGLLSQGGMGALLRAHVLDSGETVVVKVLRGQRVSELQNVRRFYQEARVASSLHHPNIVRIIEFGVDEATRAPFIAMEYVDGKTLKALIAEAGALTEPRTASLFVQISRALSAAHDAQILHRDLKPSNVMVQPTPDGDEVVKVLDFGLAKILEPDDAMPRLTQPGKTVGTPAYMSPEQVTQRPQDFRSDLYGLGCMLHAALTGSPPFTGEDLIAVMRKQMRDPPPPLPPRLFDGRPPSAELVGLHRALLKKHKNERPRSTLEVVKAFEDLLLSDVRAATTSPKEKHATILDAETNVEGQAAVVTKPARDAVDLPVEALIPSASTRLDRPQSPADAATVLTASYLPRDESATMLGGVPPQIGLDAFDGVGADTMDGDPDPVGRDPATDDSMPVFAAGTEPPEATDSEHTGFTIPKDKTDPERAARPSGRAAGFVDTPVMPPEAPTDLLEETDGSGAETIRGSVDELAIDSDSENILTTILPSDMDGSEMVDMPTPVDLGAEEQEISATRQMETDPPVAPTPEEPEPEPSLTRPVEDPNTEDEEYAKTTVPPPPDRNAERSRNRSLVLLLSAAAVVVAAAAAYPVFRARMKADAQQTERDTTKAPPPGAKGPKIVPRQRQVWIDSTPDGARIYLDDQEIGRTPLLVDVPSRTRILRLERQGFQATKLELRPDAAGTQRVQLKRKRRR